MVWLILAATIVFEVIGSTMTKLADGFTYSGRPSQCSSAMGRRRPASHTV